jgi:hypothetical protein
LCMITGVDLQLSSHELSGQAEPAPPTSVHLHFVEWSFLVDDTSVACGPGTSKCEQDPDDRVQLCESNNFQILQFISSVKKTLKKFNVSPTPLV